MKKLFLLFTFLVSMSLLGQSTYNENFDAVDSWESVNPAAYLPISYTNPVIPYNDKFSSDEALRETVTVRSAPYAWRVRNVNNRYFRYECEDIISGFEVYLAKWDNVPTPLIHIRYSTNSGTSFTNIDTIDGSYITGDLVYNLYSYTFTTPITPETSQKIYIEFYKVSGERVIFDDFKLTYITTAIADPTNFDAVTSSTIQINQTWGLNTSGDSVMVVYNTENTFGTPVGIYEVGGSISGGGTVLYKGTGTSSSHTDLTPNTKYYYKAWSKAGSGDYSSGVTDSATTYKIEPSNYPAGFTVAATGITIAANWTDATGGQLPDAYLIKISNQDNITPPADGTPVADDRDVTDGAGAINVAFGAGTFTFFRLAQNTTYYFKIYPYTNSAAAINYKTDGTAPSGSDITQSIINTNDFESNTFGTWTTYNISSGKNWTVNAGTGAYSTTHFTNINGYQGTSIPDTLENDWLISPSLNLDSYTNEKIIFFSWWKYSIETNELMLKYSNNYVSGDPTLATWTELTFTKPVNQQTWVPSGFIDLSSISGTNVHIAYHYLSTSAPRSWSVDEIAITGVGMSDPTNFNATTVSFNQIDLSWTKNNNNDDVLVAWNSSDQFGIPSGLLQENDPIDGGGTVLFRGQEEFISHIGIDAATTYYYKAWSVDPSNNYSSGVTDNATTAFAEPTNHPTEFTATSNSPSTITVSWTDSDAGHYLIKGSSVGYSSIVPPMDGIGQGDSLLVKNVIASVQSRQFTGLTPNTTYYFKIFPYNGTGESSNYKTDGIIPETSATTDDLALDIFISEIADPNNNASTRFVELFNAGATTIDFSVFPIYLCKQANGGTTWNYIALAGSVTAGGTHVVAFSASYFDTAYITTANQYSGSVCNFNGDDGIFLYYGGNNVTGILFDSYGQVNVQGDSTTTEWNYFDGHPVRKRGVTSSNPVWTADEWVIVKKVNTDNMTPYMHAADVSWQGTTSTNWNTRGTNWSGIHGWVPDASCHVTIPFTDVINFPIITRRSACHELLIESGSTLSVQSTGSLLIVGP